MPSDGYVPSCKERRKRIVSRVSEPIRQLTFSVLKFLFIIVSKEKKNNVATSEREPPADAFIVEFHVLSSNEKKKSSGSALLPAYNINMLLCVRESRCVYSVGFDDCNRSSQAAKQNGTARSTYQ